MYGLKALCWLIWPLPAVVLEPSSTQRETVNVLADPEIRQGIKDYSNWPTIPQLYIAGKFIGGCDIVTEMHQSGELAKELAAAVDCCSRDLALFCSIVIRSLSAAVAWSDAVLDVA